MATLICFKREILELSFSRMLYTTITYIDSPIVLRWFKNLQIFDYELIIISCMINNHWVLMTINSLYREIKYCDSLKGSGQEVKRNIFEWLKQFSIVRYGTELFEINGDC